MTEDWYVLEYNPYSEDAPFSPGSWHIQRVSGMLETNIKGFKSGGKHRFVPVGIVETLDEAEALKEKLLSSKKS